MEDLVELTRLTVIDIVDNETDSLSSSCSCMQPSPNITSAHGKVDERPCTYTQEFMKVIKEEKALDFRNVCHAAHGLSLLLIAEYDVIENDGRVTAASSHLLFDAGPDPELWKSNVDKLKIDLHPVETIVLSHYHVDHSNGLRSAVPEIYEARRKVDMAPPIVDLHSSKIVSRGMKIRGKVHPMLPNNPTEEEIQNLGGKVSFHNKAHLVGQRCFYVSGQIPRINSFEKGIPGHFRGLPDGNWVPDENISDERYVAVQIRGRGVIVFSACSHAGIINVCHDVMDKLQSKLTGVVGGFHLAGRSVEGKIDSTIQELQKINPEIILSGHCTGWRAKAKLYEAFEYNYQPLSSGGRYVFNAMNNRRKAL